MFQVSHLLGVVHVMLNDAVSPVQINDDELFSIFKQELDLLSLADKRLFSERRTLVMSRGTTQNVPDNCSRLLELLVNVDDVCNVGRAITYADKSLLTQRFPNWRSEKKRDIVYNYMVGENNRVYEVYPPQTGGARVVAVVSINPTLNLTIHSEIYLSDSYIKVLSHAVAGSYLTKDTADEFNLKLGMEYKAMAAKYLKTIGA